MLIPKPVVDKCLEKGGEFVPILGPAFKYTRKAIQVSKIADPVTALTPMPFHLQYSIFQQLFIDRTTN